MGVIFKFLGHNCVFVLRVSLLKCMYFTVKQIFASAASHKRNELIYHSQEHKICPHCQTLPRSEECVAKTLENKLKIYLNLSII